MKTFSRIAEVAWYQENVKILELTLARKMPVFDAEYGRYETTPIRLYDCLVPRLQEHKKKHFDIRGHMKIEDFSAQVKAKELELKLRDCDRLLQENTSLKEQVQHQ